MVYLKVIPFITLLWFFLFWLISRTLGQSLKHTFKDWWKELLGAYAITIVLIIVAIGPIGRIG